MKILSILLMLTLFTFSCKKKEEKLPIRNITFGFESILEDWGEMGGNREISAEDDIVISVDTMSEGFQSAKFTVSPSSNVAGGNRAELTFDQNAVEGDIGWYQYSFFIPENYQDVALNDADGKVNWQVLGQWHHQPVFAEGETWENYTGENASPPIAIYYNYFDSTDQNYQALRNDSKATAVHGFNTAWNKVSTISIVYGEGAIAIHEIKKGTWNNIKFQIKWSEGDDGFIQVWMNNTEFTDGRIYGANMLNKASHYFKFGLYRNPTIPHTNQLYYDDVRIWSE
ncbi:hypothetical protein DNU06_07975 [Putridiphycobacter roseus]|uniref:Polysaccharide lyase n=1 Tax=Putridiphycobacter roseus TaxID=2219161 RepID=A0A2W1NNI0_9FLAO|nr:polysaccharide lyase [Putridiphycobacter roseus]PZE17202.1 hypothetical protein DNU06_07975 [Putridiphycobacter roseus]